MKENFSLEKAFEIVKLSDLKSKPLEHYEKLEKSNSYLYQSFLLNSELNDEEEIENTFIINPNTNIILKEDLEKMLNKGNAEEIQFKNSKQLIESFKAQITSLIRISTKGNLSQTNFSLNYLTSEKPNLTKNNIIALNQEKESNSIITKSNIEVQENKFEEALKKKEEKPKKKTTTSNASNKVSDIPLKQNSNNVSSYNNNNKINKNNNNKNEAKKGNFEKRPYIHMNLEDLKKENESLKNKIKEINARNKDANKKEEEIKKLKALTSKWKRISQDTCYSLIDLFPNTQDGKRTTLKSLLDFFKVDYSKMDYDEENDEFLNY